MPAAVIVTKDVGGYVTDYQNQTALYRASQREVRLHECRSACTLALSLPNVCVYPDSILKFHLAYDPRDHQPNASVSQELFDSYPATVRARLGTLTRDYKILRGSELISLGIRDCNAPRTIEPREPKPSEPTLLAAAAAARKQPVAAPPASSPETPVLASLMGKVLAVFGTGEAARAMPVRAMVAQQRPVLVAEIPLPPPRPFELAQASGIAGEVPLQAPGQEADAAEIEATAGAGGQIASETALAETVETAPLPPRRPGNAALFAMRRLARIALPKLITGAQPILPPDFSGYADLDR
jgi:hypothetical protein